MDQISFIFNDTNVTIDGITLDTLDLHLIMQTERKMH